MWFPHGRHELVWKQETFRSKENHLQHSGWAWAWAVVCLCLNGEAQSTQVSLSVKQGASDLPYRLPKTIHGDGLCQTTEQPEHCSLLILIPQKGQLIQLPVSCRHSWPVAKRQHLCIHCLSLAPPSVCVTPHSPQASQLVTIGQAFINI